MLATEATALAHGRDAAEQAAETARRAFEEGEAAETLPTHLVEPSALAGGIPVFRLLASSGLAASNGEARRLIRGGGARVNDVAVTDEAARGFGSRPARRAVKLSAGRKQHRPRSRRVRDGRHDFVAAFPRSSCRAM